jgi:predicted MFS family arabinose efflux permease
LASITTRFTAGKVSDRLGRVPVLKVSTVLIAASMILFAHTDRPWMLYLASVIFGFGNGIFSPAINAWTIDLGDPAHKGRALATMFIALEIAIGGGAALGGWYFARHHDGMPAVFYGAAAMSLLGLLYLLLRRPSALRPLKTV